MQEKNDDDDDAVLGFRLSSSLRHSSTMTQSQEYDCFTIDLVQHLILAFCQTNEVKKLGYDVRAGPGGLELQ